MKPIICDDLVVPMTAALLRPPYDFNFGSAR